ncbi:MAG: hypothetical protein F6K39_23855 [Okeania sp. SIO3B3]|nr:hypothetical protein [Okeania sp. SIO3B3]
MKWYYETPQWEHLAPVPRIFFSYLPLPEQDYHSIISCSVKYLYFGRGKAAMLKAESRRKRGREESLK